MTFLGLKRKMKQDNLPDLWWLSIDGVVQDNLVKLMDVELKKNTYKGHDVQLLNSEECDSSDWCKIQFSLAVSKEDESSFEEDVMVINEDNDASFSSKMTPNQIKIACGGYCIESQIINVIKYLENSCSPEP